MQKIIENQCEFRSSDPDFVSQKTVEDTMTKGEGLSYQMRV